MHAACTSNTDSTTVTCAWVASPASTIILSLPTVAAFPAAAAAAAAAASAAVCWDYAQSLEELLVEVQVPAATAEQDVAVQISQQHLLVTVLQVPVIDAPLAGQVLPQCSSWQLGACEEQLC
jgi:hypothetical protein